MLQKKEFASLNGLRGISVLLVLLTHSGITVSSNVLFNVEFNNLIYFGRYGVVIFFLLSAFTVYHSLYSRGNFNLKDYIIKRSFRILPLYYLICIIGFIFGGSLYYLDYFNITNNIYNLLSHLSFLNYIDKRYQNSLIGVEWTIPIEILFYIFIPLVYWLLRKNINYLKIILIFSLIISISSATITQMFYGVNNLDLYNYWSIFPYFFTYSLGIYTYHQYQRFPNKHRSRYLLLLLLSFLAYILSGTFKNFNYQIQILQISIFTAFLVYLIISSNRVSGLLFENRIVVFIGKISYSLYLIHFIVFNNITLTQSTELNFIINSIVAIVISIIVYFFIEKPFIQYGKNFLKVKVAR